MQQTSPPCATLHARLHAAETLQGSRSLAVPLSRIVPRLHHGPKPVCAVAPVPSPSHRHHQQQAKARALLMASKERSHPFTHSLWEVPRCAAPRLAAPVADLAVRTSQEAKANAASAMATSTVSLPARKAARTMLLHALSWAMLLLSPPVSN